jgi:hypothetical protein
MAVQGAFSLASGKANKMSPFRPHSSQEALRGMGTARPGADQEEFE